VIVVGFYLNNGPFFATIVCRRAAVIFLFWRGATDSGPLEDPGPGVHGAGRTPLSRALMGQGEKGPLEQFNLSTLPE
jgi:hypothetical protein